ncbi:hypothetical protein GGH94_005788 [Coemansia aciculifera]|uniref:Uncharacterized protein n=1 Tax=Coemansia aciculifera TaxID=417176 RepID=A0A9W8IFF6_9FUNG|nr:hypothetical protein GGH94_005788 [Coemansia aciculifera]
MLDIAPDATVRKISDWYLDPAPPPVLTPLGKHDVLQVLALPDVYMSLWGAMTLIQSLPLLSDLHAKAPTLDPMPAGVTKRRLISYVCSKYSPMGTRFRRWHIGRGDVEFTKDVAMPLLLLALACPNFDYAAVVHDRRKAFAELREEAIGKVTYKKHAPRLCRLLNRKPE